MQLAILVNKNVMVDVGFRFPTTVAFMGLLTTTVLSYATVQLLNIPQEQRTKVTPRFYLNQVGAGSHTRGKQSGPA